MAPAPQGLLARILRANDEAARRYGENTAEVDAFIHSASQLSPWQWRQVLTARRLVSTVTKEDAAQATQSLQSMQAAIRTTDGRVSEPMSKAGEALFEALDKKTDDKVATAWQALSALVMREHLSALKFAAHYAPFISLIPVSGFEALDPETMRYLTAVQALTKEKCEMLARRWRLDPEASRALLGVVAKSRYLKAEEAAALLALRTVPVHVTGDSGWAAVKTVVHGGRVLGARAELTTEQIAILWAPLEPAIPLATIEAPVSRPVRARVRAAVARAATAITKPPPPESAVAAIPPPPKRSPAPKPPAPFGPNNQEVNQFIKGVVELTTIQWLRVLDRRKLVGTITRQSSGEPAGMVRALLAAINGTRDLDTFNRCRAFAAVERAAGAVAAKAQLTYEESMRGYGAFGEIVQLDYVDSDGFAHLVAALNSSDWVKVAESVPAVNQYVVAPLVNTGSALHVFLESRSDEEAVAAWEAASGLVRRQQTAPIKFAVSYAPFASAIPVTNPRTLGAPVLRYISAIGRLSANQCAVLAQPWRIDDDLSTALSKAAEGGRTAEEAAALAAVVTVPMRVSGSEGWAAAKTAAFGGRVMGSRTRLSLMQLELLWRPIQAAIPLASLGAISKARSR
jgi:CRISPR/Cas system CSM-associated protein Csm2 small subunit